MDAFKKTVVMARLKYFSDFGKKQIFLMNLLTHPDYQRHGAGTLLVDRGLEEANASRSVLSLLASPMGKPLYTHLGFEDLGAAVVHVEGEEERLCVNAMAYVPGSSTPPTRADSCAQFRSLGSEELGPVS